MAAGMSTKQINSRIRYRLQKFAYELELKGVRTVYRKYQVFPDMTGLTSDIGFNISYSTYRASNGESGGFAHITVTLPDGSREVYGHMQPAGSFEKGMDRIVELFAQVKKPVESAKPDFAIENHGSIYLIRPLNDKAADWLKSVTPDDAQWFCNALVVEPRYVADIVSGAIAEGFTFPGSRF